MFLSEDGTDSSDVFRFPACTVGSSLDGIIIGAGKQNVLLWMPFHGLYILHQTTARCKFWAQCHKPTMLWASVHIGWSKTHFGGRHSPVPLKKLDIDIHRKSCQHCYFVTWCFLFHWITQDKYAPKHSTSFTNVQWWWIIQSVQGSQFSVPKYRHISSHFYTGSVFQFLYVLCSFSHKNLRHNSEICKMWVTPGVLAMRLQKCHALVLICVFSIVYPNLANTLFFTRKLRMPPLPICFNGWRHLRTNSLIQSLIRASFPDWLPTLLGSSFW